MRIKLITWIAIIAIAVLSVCNTISIKRAEADIAELSRAMAALTDDVSEIQQIIDKIKKDND